MRDRFLDRVIVSKAKQFIVLDVEEIDWMQADGNYVRLHVEGESYLFRSTLKDLEARLDPKHFLRIHRSTIVNVHRIERLVPLEYGDFTVVLSTGEELRMARGRKDVVSERFGGAL